MSFFISPWVHFVLEQRGYASCRGLRALRRQILIRCQRHACSSGCRGYEYRDGRECVRRSSREINLWSPPEVTTHPPPNPTQFATNLHNSPTWKQQLNCLCHSYQQNHLRYFHAITSTDELNVRVLKHVLLTLFVPYRCVYYLRLLPLKILFYLPFLGKVDIDPCTSS
jgi:hypothetical protein